MTSPGFPREIAVELFLQGTWLDVGGDRRESEDIEISRGRRNETSRPEPSQCSFMLDDRAHNYSPDNPVGAYYGELGLNTPIRVGITTARDSFGRTVVAGWGSADVGGAYTLVGAGGTTQNSDWNVSGVAGTQSVPAVNAYRLSYLPAVSYRNVDVAATFSLAITDVTGGDLDAAIILRGRSSTDYYVVRASITPTESVTLSIKRFDGTTVAPVVTVAGLTHTSAQALRVRAQAEGHTIRAKVWAASGDEPYGWHISGNTFEAAVPGWVGVRGGVTSGNTNTLPVVFTWDNLVVSSIRLSGEISSITPRWDLSDSDEYVLVEAAGVTQRLGQGAAPVASTLRRGISTLSPPPVAYWPGEDGVDATAVSSATGGQPMGLTTFGTATEFATYDEIPSSAPLPKINGSAWAGVVPSYTDTGQVQLRYLMHIPSASAVFDTSVISQLHTSGTTDLWEIKYHTGGALSLTIWKNWVQLHTSGPIAFNIDDQNVAMSLELTQNGANIDWKFVTLDLGASFGQFISGTLNSRTVGKATRVLMSPYQQLEESSIGHVSVHNDIIDIFDLSDEFNAYVGETALARMLRLCGQNDVAFSYIGGPEIESAAMGPQRVETLLTLLDECADADLGTLYETRGELGLTYRERASLYNQPAVMVLDYGGGQVAAPFEPRRDDQLVRNDVIATRTDAGSAHAVLEAGPLSVLPRQEGGVGRYDTEVTVNVHTDEQLPDIAGWLLHLGTVNETRYPSVRVDLATPAVVADAELLRAMLDLDIDDRSTIVNPKAGQTPDTITQLARGFTERINLFHHSIAINAAPESPYQVVETDEAESRLDGDGSDLSSGITTTVTSFSVDTPSGPLWSTDAADAPMLFTIGGETISVGAVSGATSPQTFGSVTRSVNGVVKSHSAGVAVELTRRMTLAL